MMLIFAVLRLRRPPRARARRLRDSGSETALLSAALQDAVTKLKAQEQAMSARAVASEQLSGQIVESLTAGLLVVDRAGRVEILNPAGPPAARRAGRRRSAATTAQLLARRRGLAGAASRECLATGIAPVARRRIPVDRGSGDASRRHGVAAGGGRRRRARGRDLPVLRPDRRSSSSRSSCG